MRTLSSIVVTLGLLAIPAFADTPAKKAPDAKPAETTKAPAKTEAPKDAKPVEAEKTEGKTEKAPDAKPATAKKATAKKAPAKAAPKAEEAPATK